MSKIPILILAAGASSRMRGADKLTQTIDGEALIHRTARIARDTGQPVLVALPPAPHPRHDAIADLDIRRIDVPNAAEGMNASLRTGLAQLPEDAEAVMILLADLPEITTADLRKVADAFRHDGATLIWRGATDTGKAGHPVLFSRRLFGELARLTGDSGAQSVVSAHKDRVALIPLPGLHALRDLDTPEDWAAWRASRSPES